MERARLVASAMDALSAHVAILDSEGTILAANRAWRNFATDNPPTPADAFVGVNYLAVCDGASGANVEGAAEFAAGLRAVMHGQQDEFVLEYPCHAPWEERWFIGRVTRFTGDGQTYTVVAHENITQRKRAEIGLRHSREYFRALVENGTDIIAVTDSRGVIQYISLSVQRALGFAPDEMTDRSVFDFVYPDDVAAAQTTFALGLQNPGITRSMEVRLRHQAGGWRIIEALGNLLTLNGNDPEVIITARDITERKQAEAEQARLLHDLNERVKELTTLQRVSEALQDDDTPIPALLETVANLLPDGLQYPELAGARVGFDGVVRATPDFADTPWQLSIAFRLSDGRQGALVMAYLREPPDAAAPPFLAEEMTLLRTCAEMMQAHLEKRFAAASRRASEERLRAVLENMPVMLDAFDEQYNIIAWNHECERVTGYTAAEIIGNPHALALLYPDPAYHAAMVARWQERRGDYRNWEWQVTAKDGRVKTILWSNLADRFPIPGWNTWGIGVDITERKQAEAALQASETRYRGLFENMMAGFAYCQMLFEDGEPQDFIYLAVNPAFETLTGLKDVVGKRVSEVIPGIRQTDPELFAIYGRVALSGQPETFEIFLTALQLWFAVSVYSPEPGHFAAVFDVITERKRAEEALRLQAHMLDAVGEAVVANDLNLNVTYWNHGAETMFGWTAAETIGRMAFDFIPINISPDEVTDRIRRMQQGETISDEFVVQRRDGAAVPILVSSSPFRNPQGDIVGIVNIAIDVTERRRTEEQLRMLWLAFEQSISSIVITDVQGHIEYVNPHFTEVTGYTAAEVIGQKPSILKSGLTPPEVYADLWATITAGENWRGELCNRNKHGDLFWEAVTIGPVRDNQGQIVRFVAIKHDITAHKQAEATIRHYADRLEVLHQIDTAILSAQSPTDIAQATLERIARLIPCQWSAVTIFHPAQMAYERIAAASSIGVALPLGHAIPMGSIVGLDALKRGNVRLLPDLAERDDLSDTQKELLRQGIRTTMVVPLVVHGEVIGTLNLGSTEPHTFTTEHTTIAQEVANQLAIAIEQAQLRQQLQTELAERTRAEQAARQYANRLATLRDIDEAILSAKDPAEIAQATLDRLETLVPYDWASVTVSDRSSQTSQRIAQYVAKGIALPASPAIPRANTLAQVTLERGEVYLAPDLQQVDDLSPRQAQLRDMGIRAMLRVPLIVHQQTIGILNMGATEPGIFSPAHVEIAREVADVLAVAIAQAQLRADLQRYNAELQQAVKVRDEMIQNVSHEFRTPLTHIIGYADLLEISALGGQLNKDQQYAVEIIQQRAQDLTRIVNTILTLQSLSADDLHWGMVYLGFLAARTVERWQGEAAANGITITIVEGADVPAVAGDQERLRQALDHLLENAIKFTPDGGTVTVTTARHADEAWISISDTGIGIPQEQLTRIFSPFYQVDGSTTRRFGGVGVGLALVKQIVGLHGGRVWAESDGVDGHGATVRIALPLTADATPRPV